MRKKAFHLSFLAILATTVWYLGSHSSLPTNTVGSVEETSGESKKNLESKPSNLNNTNPKRISVKRNKIEVVLTKIAEYKIIEHDKVKMMRAHILSSKYPLKGIMEELRNASAFLSEDSIQELLFLSVRHCSTIYPYEIYESIKDQSIETLGFEDFFSDENGIGENAPLLFESIYTGLLESGEPGFLKDLKKNDAWLLNITEVLISLGKKNDAKWALKNRGVLSEREFSRIVAITSNDYKSEALDKIDKNYNYAVNWAKNFEKGSIEEAYAFGIIAVQQYQYEKFHNKPKDWIKSIEPGFIRDRTTSGFALGASRFYEEENLENKLKKMFTKNNFKMEETQSLIKESTLPEEVKNELLAINSNRL